jgi:hypothetical protein
MTSEFMVIAQVRSDVCYIHVEDVFIKGVFIMLKNIVMSILIFSFMTFSATSSAEILVNHHGQPFQESHAKQGLHHRSHQITSHQRSMHRSSYSGHQHRQRLHYRSYSQHSKVVVRCLKIKNGRHYRVC